MNKTHKAFLGFDFYGAGNIGDDLMLGGFSEEFSSYDFDLRITCSLPKSRIMSQRKRFPNIEWVTHSSLQDRKAMISNSDFWVGIGDTPFQVSSGRWLLDSIESDLKMIRGQKKLMIGIGCEEEVIKEKKIASSVASSLDYIWTRDKKSKEILIDILNVDPNKVSMGGDLANISLERMFRNLTDRSREKVGFMYYSEKIDSRNIYILRKFLNRLKKERNVVFLANETRERGFEYEIYKKIFNRFSYFFSPPPIFSLQIMQTQNWMK